MTHVVIGGVSHETNTFSPIRTDLPLFERRAFLRGKDVIEQSRGVSTALGGIVDAAEDRGWKMTPTLFASATPSGIVTREAYETIVGGLVQGITDAQPVDGVLLPLHGAMVAEEFDDGEGELLRRVREAVGPNVPVITVLDFHATLTPAIAAHADIVIGYETYPHIDPYQRGGEAVELMERLIAGEIKPVRTLRQVPMLTPLPPQFTWGPTPMNDLMQLSLQLEKEPGVLCIMLAGGFTYSDIPDSGVAVLVTADADQSVADRVADQLARACWDARERFLIGVTPVDEAIERLRASAQGPVVFADVADNPGAGASCDGTVILDALLNSGIDGVAFGIIADPESVDRAAEIGAGKRGTFQLGGKVDDLHGPTLQIEATVRSVGDVSFTNTGPMGRGALTRLGNTAVLEAGPHGEVEIVVTENRVQVLDPELFRAVGIPPEQRRALVVKSSVHFRAGFEPIATEIIEVDAPGLSSPNLFRFPFERVRRPIWPLDEGVEF
ncbi:MAG: M81 family metallopeptidase [Chloroflexia bacterium]|nr:M81 family metallopeptidase [Chloroflexia bacterium]